MDGQQVQEDSTKKASATEEQKSVLKSYYEDLHMISTKQHDLMSRCQEETGLPLTYIKNWIGNANARQKGTRKGGNDYHPVGKPRRISGYNLFCSEHKVPAEVRAQGVSAQNRWWPDEWNKLADNEQKVYSSRAAAINKNDATETLVGDDFSHRKNFLLRKLASVCGELEEAGIHMAAFGVQDNVENLSGCALGIQFLKSRKLQTNRLFTQLRNYIQYAKLQQSNTGVQKTVPAPQQQAPNQDIQQPTVTPTALLQQPVISPAMVVQQPAIATVPLNQEPVIASVQQPAIVTTWLNQQAVEGLAPVVHQAAVAPYSLVQQAAAAPCLLVNEPPITPAPLVQQPTVALAAVIQQPTAAPAPVVQQPAVVTAAVVIQQPAMATSPVVQQPAVATAPVVQQPTVASAPVVQQPAIATAPVVQQPAVAPAPVVQQPAVAPAPVVQQPAVATAPVVQQPAVAPAPVVQQPAVAPAPVVQQPAVAPAPVVQQPAVAPAPVVQQPAVAPAPVVQQPAVAPTPVVQQAVTTPIELIAEYNFPCGNLDVSQQTALQILEPMSNGATVNSVDEALCAHLAGTIYTPGNIEELLASGIKISDVVNAARGQENLVDTTGSGFTKPGTIRSNTRAKKRKRKADALLGKEISHLWDVEDDEGRPGLKWYKGEVVERDGEIYRIKYEDRKDLFPLTAMSLKKSIKAETLFIL